MQLWGTSFILVTSSSRPCVSLGKSLLCLHAGQARNTGKSTPPPCAGQVPANGGWELVDKYASSLAFSRTMTRCLLQSLSESSTGSA